jgi:peptidoglycan L-alanyl-D-glutamate endopeptidase CwlK
MTTFRFGHASSKKLSTCNNALIAIAARALELSPYDFTIVHGWRGEDVQNALFDRNASTKRWPDSKHNVMADGEPASEAIDFAPWVNGTIYWDDTHIFAVIAGCFLAAAKEKGFTLRWGGDWDGDGRSKGDQKFMDYGHVEIIL